MKFFLISLFILFKLSAFSQIALPDNFKIGNFVEIFNSDSIKIYFNCTGSIVDKRCASYYRVGKMDSTIINITGNFNDYDMNGNVVLRATMLKNNLEGIAHYYYSNGLVKEEGSYQNNVRLGKWKFYYPDGTIQKIYNYNNGQPAVVEAYNSKGKSLVVNGTGNFKTDFSNYKQCDYFIAAGNLLDGKKNGLWTFSDPNGSQPIATEIFVNDTFVKGNSNNYEYKDRPRIGIAKFYPNENLNLMENYLSCPGDHIYFWLYRDSSIHETFYPELQEKLSNYNSSLKDQWIIVGIKVSKKSKILEINVASSINDLNIENYIHDILLKMTDWKTANINSSRIESNIFFTILVDNNQIIIPTDYIYRNGIVN